MLKDILIEFWKAVSEKIPGVLIVFIIFLSFLISRKLNDNIYFGIVIGAMIGALGYEIFICKNSKNVSKK